MKWRDVPVGGVGLFAGIRFRRVSDVIVKSAHDNVDHVEVEYLELAGENMDIEPGTPGLMQADIDSEEKDVPL